MEDKLDYAQISRDILFVEEPDLYPAEIWTYFAEALCAILSDEDVRVLECKFGGGEHDLSPAFVRERMVAITDQIRRSPIFSEMQTTLDLIESSDFELTGFADLLFAGGRDDGSDFVDLVADEMNRRPLTIDGFEFDTMIEGNPVYVWKFSELTIPSGVLEKMVGAVISAGYEHLYLCVPGHLMCDYPPGFPVTVLPKFEIKGPLVSIDNQSKFAN